MRFFIVLALVGCAVAAPGVIVPKRAILLNSVNENVKSSSTVDARAWASGKTNIQQSNMAKTNDMVDIKQRKGAWRSNLVQQTQADLSQKLQTVGGTVKASQNAQSNADRQLNSMNGGANINIVKNANSQATEKVIASGKASTAQIANANTLQTENVKDRVITADAEQKTSVRMNEKTQTRGGTVKASQNASSKAQEMANASRNARKVAVKQNSASQTNEQLSIIGPASASQRADANASDKLNAMRNKSGSTINLQESSNANSNQQVGVKSGTLNASQRSNANEQATLNVNSMKGKRSVKITERSNANAKGNLIANGVTQSQQSESAAAMEKARVKMGGEWIQVDDSSRANANDKVKTWAGKANTSQVSRSNSNENLNVLV